MDRRTVCGALCALMGSGGIAAMIGATKLPSEGEIYFDVLMYGGAAAVAVALVGFFVLWWTAPKAKPQKASTGSTTARASGSAQVSLTDVDSTAETLADVQEEAILNAARVRHRPSGDGTEGNN